MPTGAPSYFNALTDTRRCLPCTIIVRGKRKYVNPHAKSTLRKLLLRQQPPSFLRGCAGTATARERKSHAVRRVRLDAKAASPGLAYGI